MLTSSEKKFSIVYSLIVIAELITGSLEDFSSLHYLFKPAIVISLLIFFLLKCKTLNKKLRLIIASALLFSLAGDILLMFVDKSPNYFLFGLVAFLIAHVMYVIAFLKHRNKTLNPFGFIAFLIVYAAGLFYLVKDGLNEMLIPVLIYMLVILSMSTAAYLRKGTVSKLSYTLVFLGALFFMLSDSILALNKFYEPLAYSNISIMLTYAIAQYLIIFGILKLDSVSR
ncbi:lysoplasmalogenase [Psychroserpens luteus]|uniref:Lysoplasmalogenase n=1 Tax=Psychroserpens luteus TaxID=1434066 RepID=A0ABW5ZQQ8_9FLAO|nr:lysoplasmalogenase [Psychroserpens luteus]